MRRIIPLKEVADQGDYNEMVILSEIFQHDIIEDDHGRWRWKSNKLMCLFGGDNGGVKFRTPPEWEAPYNHDYYSGAVDLNSLSVSLHHGEFEVEEYMKYKMQTGYSLDGYYEIFGQREITEYNIKYFEPVPDDFNLAESYWETPIEYMCKKYRGKTIKL